MIIGIDGNEANLENRVGVNTYAFELLRTLAQLESEWSAKHKLIVYLRQKPLVHMPEETENFKYIVLPASKLWIITQLTPRLIRNPEKCDVFFTPSHYIPPFCFVPRVCSIMDLGYLESSEQFKRSDFWQLKLWSAYSIYVSKQIISISNATKKDIVRHYKFASKKIQTIYLAYDKNLFDTSVDLNNVRHIKNKYSIVNDYLLFLSTLKPSKNIEGLLKAFKIVTKQFPNLQLVIAGKKGWMYESIYQTVQDQGLQQSVVFTDFLPETDKPDLIKGAKVFVLPSFWEGFGLDVLSSMAAGVPVVVSNRGSLPEIVEGSGIIVDPDSEESMAEGILSILKMTEGEYAKIVAKGKDQAHKFSWEKTAHETLTALESIH